MSDSIRRITIDQVRAAVEKTRLRLIERRFCDTDDAGKVCSGCALFVVAVADGMDPKFDDPLSVVSFLRLPQNYASGFATGFDGYSHSRSINQHYELGYADGSAIREALLPEAVTV